MAMDTSSLMGFAMLGTMKKAERKRAQTPLVLTMIPGPPSTRAAFATVAVGNQASEGLRREKKVAAAVLGAIEAVAAGQPAATAFAGQAALGDLAPDQLASRLRSILDRGTEESQGAAGTGETKPDETKAEIEAAVEAAVEKAVAETRAEAQKVLALATTMLIGAIGRPKDQLFTEDEAKPFADYLAQVSAEDRTKIVK